MEGIEVWGSRLSVLSAFTLFTVYSYKVVLVHSAVVTLYSPANPSTSTPRAFDCASCPGRRSKGGEFEPDLSLVLT